MKKMTKILIAVLAMSLSVLAADQQEPPVPPPTPKAKMKPAPAPKAYAMAWSSSGGSYLGVDITEVTADRVAALKLKEERGVEITMVDRDAPAGKAGLKEHDVILELNGQRVEGEEQLRRMLRETPAGRKITLGISRDGQPMQIEATLASRETSMARMAPKVWKVEPPEFNMPDIQVPAIEMVVRSYSRRTGMMVDNLTPQLGEFFGVKSGQGVLVRSVEKGSAAEAAGLKAGDVIVKVDGEAVDDRNDWNRVMRRKGGKINLGIVRDKKEQNLTVTLPELKSSEEGRFFEWDGDDDFDFQPPAFDSERMERAVRKFQHGFEIRLPRSIEQQARVQKTLAEQRARFTARLAEAQVRMEKRMKESGARLEKQGRQLQMKLEKALRASQMI